jgi:hypothetical protein
MAAALAAGLFEVPRASPRPSSGIRRSRPRPRPGRPMPPRASPRRPSRRRRAGRPAPVAAGASHDGDRPAAALRPSRSTPATAT